MSFRSQLIHKIRTYYRETPTAIKCLGYLENKYPFVKPTIDHTAYRFVNFKDCDRFVKNADSKYVLGGHLVFPLKATDKFPKQANWYHHPFYSRMFVSFLDIMEKDEVTLKKQFNTTHLNTIPLNTIPLNTTPLNTTSLNVNIKDIPDPITVPIPNLETYNILASQDQYLAWALTWGESINHLAFDLSAYPDPFEQIIKEMAHDLCLEMNTNIHNQGDPTIMVSNDLLLKQASTKSDLVNGIPKAYIEFICRLKDPLTGNPRDGFDTFSANGIFESTNYNFQAVS